MSGSSVKATITFEGRDITRVPSHKVVEHGLVQVPEGRQILATLTIAENLQLGGWHSGGTAHRTIAEVHERVPGHRGDPGDGDG